MKKSTLLMIAVFRAAVSFAQTNFTGNWQVKNKQYISGPQYANALPEHLSTSQASIHLSLKAFLEIRKPDQLLH